MECSRAWLEEITQSMIIILQNYIKKLLNTGFFHIFGSTVINKIIGFSSNFIIVRLIDKTDYGAFTYANNIMCIVLIFSGMGMASGVLQLCSEKIDEKKLFNDIYIYGSKCGFIFNILLTIILVIIAMYISLPIAKSNYLLLLMAFNPIVLLLFQFQQIYLRSSLKNKEYSFSTTFNSCALLVCSVIGAIINDEKGLIFGIYLANIISIIFVRYRYEVSPVVLKKGRCVCIEKKVLYRISIISMLSNALTDLMYLLDIFLIGMLLADSIVVATYKVATVIPNALYFIPSAVCMYVYPYFARNKDNFEWVKRTYHVITAVMMLVNLIITLIMILCAPIIIDIFFGTRYLDVVNCFRILSIGYFFNGSFRAIAGNLLVTQRKIEFNLLISVISILLNVVGNLTLIPIWGIEGAAITTAIVQMIIGFISTIYFIHIINSNKANA